jgi:hypothetical protein
MSLAARSLTALLILVVPPLTADAQWLAAAYGGALHTGPGEVRIEQPARRTDVVFPEVQFNSQSWTPPIYYGYRLARRMRGIHWLYVEAELVHGKLFLKDPDATHGSGTASGQRVSAVPFSSLVRSFAMSHGLNLILANAVVRRSAGPERLTWTARAGTGAVVPHAESQVDGRVDGTYQLAGTAVQLSGGIEIEVWRGLGVAGDYKWTRARPRVSLAEGTATVAARSHHLTFGVVAAF